MPQVGAAAHDDDHGATEHDLDRSFRPRRRVLDAAGWSPAGTAGYVYLGPTGGDGDPVKKVVLKRTPAGRAFVKVVLKGKVGTQSLGVVPPNLGDEGGLILTINGGGTYRTLLGGPAGGTEVKDESTMWKLTAASSQGCPVP